MYDTFNIFNEQKNSDQHKKIQNFTNDTINETAQLISNVSIRAAAAASEIMSSANNQHNFFNSYASCAKDNINNMKNFASALFTSWEKNFMNCNNTVTTGKKTSS